MNLKLFRNVDYSNPLFFKQIERDNKHIYRRIFEIYSHKPQVSTLSSEHRHQQAEFHKSKNSDRLRKQREIHEENVHVYVRVVKAKPTESLTVNACDKHWQLVLEHKRRRCLSKRAAIISSY